MAICVKVMRTAIAPMGTLPTKKIQRQPMPLVMAPPMSGPMATAPPIDRAVDADAVPRVASRERGGDQGERGGEPGVAPQTPWTARARLSMRGVVEGAQTSEASEKTTNPTAKILRRP